MYFVSFVVCMQEIYGLVRPDRFMASKWRWEARESGRHSHLATQVPQLLDPDVANELQDLDIGELQVKDLRELARIVGVSPSGNKDALILRLAPLMQSIHGMCLEFSS